MAAVDDHSRSGLSRRDALRLLAASSTTVAAGSMIISQPAHADSGSASCRYEFAGAPQVTAQITNQSGGRRDFLSISVSNVGGDCPCGSRTAPIEYAYWIIIPGTGSGGAGWITSNAVSVRSPSTLWGNQGGSVTISVGIQVTCPAAVGDAVRCRFGSATFNVAGPNSNTSQGFTLGSNNGNSRPPTGIPACGPAAPRLRSAPLLGSSGATGGLSVVAGAGSPPPYDPNAGDAETDLGGVETDPTTTTTDAPGKRPDSKPSRPDEPPTPADPTTTTSTPAPSTTTSPADPTTTTSTPAPSSTSPAPPAD